MHQWAHDAALARARGLHAAMTVMNGGTSRMIWMMAMLIGLGLTLTSGFAQQGSLRPGSDPTVLPGPVLIADRGNDRLVVVDPQGRVLWTFPEPGDLSPGETFRVPDDAFYTPDGRRIIVTHEDDFTITLVDVASRRIVWRYVKPGVYGSEPDRLWNPDDAIVLPDGHVLVADIKNCRVLLIAPESHAPKRIFGAQSRPPGGCDHHPPRIYGSPNGAFPMRIHGAWVNELDLRTGEVGPSIKVPGVRYPSDTNEAAPGRYLTVGYSRPGQILLFDPAGRALWRYKPAGPAALDRPSLALMLPNGDVLCNDDYNHRVVVVDSRTNRIVWQYGETGHPGRDAGRLNIPDGVDLLPPHSLLITHAQTMGRP